MIQRMTGATHSYDVLLVSEEELEEAIIEERYEDASLIRDALKKGLNVTTKITEINEKESEDDSTTDC